MKIKTWIFLEFVTQLIILVITHNTLEVLKIFDTWQNT